MSAPPASRGASPIEGLADGPPSPCAGRRRQLETPQIIIIMGSDGGFGRLTAQTLGRFAAAAVADPQEVVGAIARLAAT